MKQKTPVLTTGGVLVALLSAAVVFGLFGLALRQPSPGRLSEPHASVTELLGPDACTVCHGSNAREMAAACASCHAQTEADIADGSGFHGALELGIRNACGECHLEHNGGGFPLVSNQSFKHAGFASREDYDHGGPEFALAEHRDELGCVECHANADLKQVAEGELRFLGLETTCSTCHEDVHEGELGMDCGECHGQQQPFVQVASFEHENFVAKGAHAGLDCRECHVAEGEFALQRLFEEGEHPDERSCLDCHESPHTEGFINQIALFENTSAAESCAACHSAEHLAFTEQWEAMPRDYHVASGVELVAAHAEIACVDCHAGSDFEERFPGRPESSCTQCHEDPHAGQFEPLRPRSGALANLSAAGSTCLDCHTRDAFLPSTFDVEAHDGNAFTLEDSHRALACGECHVRPGPDEALVFRGTEQACEACHTDVHRDVFKGLACDECHVPSVFSEVLEGAFEHGSSTGFELRGVHAAAECESCHPRAARPDRNGRSFGLVATHFGTPAGECSTCHQDVHDDSFDGPDRPQFLQGRSTCGRCHTQESFQEPLVAEFDHGLWTGHALDGAHATIDCEACHLPRESRDANGRAFGRVVETFGAGPAVCSLCHTDVHAGAFDQAGLPPIVDGFAGCARCHDSTSFSGAVRAGFDHGLWTGFQLAGDHRGLSCESCHDPDSQHNPSEYNPDGRSLGWAAGRDCFDCHGDPHVGQFVEAGGSDCARCHAGQGGLVFDHDLDSDFPLDETHRELECSVCHIPWPLADGRQVVRYKPLGTTCADCHGEGFEEGRE